MPKSSQHTWNDIKQVISTMPRAGLLRLIHDLYDHNQDVRDFVNARFVRNDDALEAYKTKMRQYLIMKSGWDFDKISVSKAKSVITSYKKAKGDTAGMAELCVTYVEFACTTFNENDMSDYSTFYSAFDIMIAQACAYIAQLPPTAQPALVLRLHAARSPFVDSNHTAEFAKYGFDSFIED
jgi:hypothetical protein